MKKLNASFVIGVFFALAFVSTCAESVGPMSDLGPRDAIAAQPMAADCTNKWSYSLDNAGQLTTYYYARFTVPGFDPRSPWLVTTTLCDPIGANPVWLCPDGARCDPPLATPSCTSVGSVAFTAASDIYVYCGYELVNNGKTTAQRWKTAYLKVGP